VIIREAVSADLPAVVALLADDVLGKARNFAVVDEKLALWRQKDESPRAAR